MLKPSMQQLLKKVGNRYLLVNLSAQRARDLSVEAEQTGIPMSDKAVKLALDEIVDGKIIYSPGRKPEIPVIKPKSDVLLSLGLEDEEEGSDEEDQDDILFDDEDEDS